MKNIDNMQDTFKKFKQTIGKIRNATSSSEIAELELECVRKLQLCEVQIAMCGYDLKDAVIARRRELAEVKAQPKPETETEVEPEPETETEVEPEPETEVEPETETEVEAEAKTKTSRKK